MSFFDEIKRAQKQGLESRIQQDNKANEQTNKAIEDTVKMISFRIKESLIEKAKQTTPDRSFTYDGFVYCFAFVTTDTNLLTTSDIFHKENFLSCSGPITITLTPLGIKVFNLVKSALSADGINVVSFCCREGETNGCLELPVVVKYTCKATRAIWQLKGSNKRVKVEHDKFDTCIDDYINLGAHVIFMP